MKRIFFFISIAMLGVIYYSAGRPMEIADRVMIHAIGIDPEGSGFRVTMQVFSPTSGGSETAIDPSQPNVSIVGGSGRNVAEAINDCETHLGGRVFIGQNKLIVFGRSIDMTRKNELLGFFLSSSEAYLNTDCAMSSGTAAELLSVPMMSGGITSEKLAMMISSECERGRCAKCSLMQLLESSEEENGSVLMPEFSLMTKPKGGSADSSGEEGSAPEKLPESSRVILNKCAVLREGRFAGELSGSEAGLAAAINGSGTNVFADAEYNGQRLGCTLHITDRDITAFRENGELIIRAKLTAAPADEQFFPDSREREGHNRAALEKLTAEANELADKLGDSGGAEILGTERILRRHFPSLLRKHGAEALTDMIRFEIVFG
ncbi:MAG: hypothetical protein K6B74_06280 [Ruminococcus sp.]|nr:hypothetical protein [Ruminococcus sp.]